MTSSSISSGTAAPRSIEFRIKRRMSLEAYKQRKACGELPDKEQNLAQHECDVSNEADRLVDMAETDERLEYLLKRSPNLTSSESAELELHHRAVHTILQYAAESEVTKQRSLHGTVNGFDPFSDCRRRKREREEREDEDIVRAEQEMMMMLRSSKRRRFSRPCPETISESNSSSESDTFVPMTASRILQEQAKRDVARGEQEMMMLRPSNRRRISRPSRTPISASSSSSNSETFVPMTTSRILKKQIVANPTAWQRRRISLQAPLLSIPFPARIRRLHTEIEEEDDIMGHPSTPNAIVRRRLLIPKSRVLEKRVCTDMHGRTANPCTVPPRGVRRAHTEIEDETIEYPDTLSAIVRRRRLAVKGKVRDGTLFAYIHGRADRPSTPPPSRKKRPHTEPEEAEIIEHPSSPSAIVRRRCLTRKGKVSDKKIFADVYGRRW